MTLRKSLLSTVAVTLTASFLVMGGCSPKDKGESAQISVEAAPLGLTAPNEKVFARHFDVPKRTVSEADATAALKAFSLDTQDTMTWDNRAGGAGNYVYTDLGATTDEGTISIGKAELVGVRMEGDEETFDRANFQDMVIKGDDVNLKVGAMSIARPTPKMAQAIIRALQTNEGLDDLEIEMDEGGKVSFGAISINDISLTADEATGTIEHLVWGVNEDTDIGDGKIGAMDFTIKGDNDVVSTFTFKGGSARGVNAKTYNDLSAGDVGQNTLGQILGQMNLYAKPYDDFQIGEGVFENEFLKASFEGFEGKAVEKGGVTTITQVGKPMRLAFLKEPSDPNAQRGYDTLKQLGFDEIVFKTSQTQVLDKNKDTVAVKDGLIDMENGFRLNYTYEAEGLSAMVEKAKADERGETSEMATNMTDVIDSLEPVKLRQMKMSLEDKSIVERGLKLASEMTGQSESNLKRQLKIAVMAAPFMAQNDLEGQIIGEIGGAFTDFVDNGGTMTISIKPPAPLSVKTLAEARENNLNPDDLGFSASVEK